MSLHGSQMWYLFKKNYYHIVFETLSDIIIPEKKLLIIRATIQSLITLAYIYIYIYILLLLYIYYYSPRGEQIFPPNIWKPPQISKRPKGDTQPVPYCGPTHIMRHRTKFAATATWRPGFVHPCIKTSSTIAPPANK
jgi:hypothetical protein